MLKIYLVSVLLFLAASDVAEASHFFVCDCRAEVVQVERFDTVAYESRGRNSKEVTKPIVLRYHIWEEIPFKNNGPYASGYDLPGPANFDGCARSVKTMQSHEFILTYSDYVAIQPGDYIRVRMIFWGDVSGSTLSMEFRGILE